MGRTIGNQLFEEFQCQKLEDPWVPAHLFIAEFYGAKCVVGLGLCTKGSGADKPVNSPRVPLADYLGCVLLCITEHLLSQALQTQQ